MFDYRDYVRHRTTLSGQKSSAWALAVGARPRAGFDDLPSRNRRGALPDVDFDRAAPEPGHRPLFQRIVEFFWGGMRDGIVEPSARAELRAELSAALGERLANAYLGEEGPEFEAIETSPASARDSEHDEISRAA
jgi:hypothetical protein